MALDGQRLAAQLAEDLFATLPTQRAPVDLSSLVAEEPIRVFVDDFGTAFDGRLEYEASADVFLAFCNSNTELGGPERMRFSLAHELGHYFIDAHRELIRNPANAHFSKAGFVSDALIEREADAFAARLLVPDVLLGNQADRIDISVVEAVAQRFDVSFLCSALRCVEATREACALVVAVGNDVRFCVRSEDLFARGGFHVPKGQQIPHGSAASAVRASARAGGERILERATPASTWTEHLRWQESEVWEYAVYHPNLDRTVSLLICAPHDED